MSGAEPADVLFPGDGEMARRMRAFPWPNRSWVIRAAGRRACAPRAASA